MSAGESVSRGRRGRRAGKPDTRAEILDVARRRFLLDGYQAVTMRGVAQEAGVDAALVSYYFGSKKGLLGAALALAVNPPELLRAVLAGDPATLPERLVRTVIGVWDDPEGGRPLRLLVTSAGNDPEVARLLREVLQTEMIGPLAERLGGADASARAAAFGAQIAGLLLVRYWLEAEPVASMPVADLVRHAAPGLHAAMRGPARRPPPPGISSGSSSARR
ncbi:TetR/AcrR family transcriptional regulator [Nocardioides sp. T2.26MG-1]|uniref:TetR/AcrR family transcriptional regulator n=1 Tax=Nocardioides sp. T2.26MG-1 TaxID=3041166 RepID=UPI0024773BF0|nr:TetR family transcriptional regulator [Nocardioides sp. T2.26MG-1]CAI9413065.1 HTH-type transcriptional regulator BetI [Nocardioides sp. T2.26MG-1]